MPVRFISYLRLAQVPDKIFYEELAEVTISLGAEDEVLKGGEGSRP